mgnify:CR=1 FL=1
MIAVRKHPRQGLIKFISNLNGAGIRFIYFSRGNERQTKAFAGRLGLETVSVCLLFLLVYVCICQYCVCICMYLCWYHVLFGVCMILCMCDVCEYTNFLNV